jgi:hypothetical protein
MNWAGNGLTVKNNTNRKQKIFYGCKMFPPHWKIEICPATLSDIFTKITETFHAFGKNSLTQAALPEKEEK